MSSRMTATTPLPYRFLAMDTCLSAASKMMTAATPLSSHLMVKYDGTAPSLEIELVMALSARHEEMEDCLLASPKTKTATSLSF